MGLLKVIGVFVQEVLILGGNWIQPAHVSEV